jgi:hypothetical protein
MSELDNHHIRQRNLLGDDTEENLLSQTDPSQIPLQIAFMP